MYRRVFIVQLTDRVQVCINPEQYISSFQFSTELLHQPFTRPLQGIADSYKSDMHIVDYSNSDNTGWWTCTYSDLDCAGFKILIPGNLKSTFGYKFALEDAVFLEGKKVLTKTLPENFCNIHRFI